MTPLAETSRKFHATLAQPLNFGHILEICGKVQQNADRISIDFSRSRTTENSKRNEIYLQILLDFLKKQIIFTQYQVNSTNSNQHAIRVTKDLILAEFLNDFKFYIMLAETKFHIALNDKPLSNFKYEYNQNLLTLQIQQVEIVGKMEYVRQFDHHKYFPHLWPPIQISDDYLDFSNEQPMSFKPGHIMIITACLEGNNKGRFIIQFRHARDNKRQELHVSVRFDTKKIIRNAKCRQADDKLAFDDEEVDGFTFLFSRFGQEEIDDNGVFPFEDFGKPFKLAVALCEQEFRLAKDGQVLFKFSYRSPNILRHIMGPKIFGTNGVNVRVWDIDHLCLEDELCNDFEKYSI